MVPKADYRQKMKPKDRTIVGLVILALSVTSVLLLNIWLLFIWEMRIDGKEYRRLYPAQLVVILSKAAVIVGAAAALNMCTHKFPIPTFAYPMIAALYIGGAVAFTHWLTYDFSVSLTHPLIPKSH